MPLCSVQSADMTDEERRFNNEMTVHLAVARQKFAAFYARAGADEILLFDSLLMSHVLLAAGMAVSGRNIPSEHRRTFERDNVAVEQMFTDFREKVRASVAFKTSPKETIALIERDVFDVQPEVRPIILQ